MKTAASYSRLVGIRNAFVRAVFLLLLGAGLAVPAAAQSNSCAASGLQLIAKFEVNGSGQFVFAEGTPGAVTISNVQTKPGEPSEPISADFSSTVPVSAVYVKSGQNEATDTYNPPVFSGSFDNGGANSAISNVSFCQREQIDLECESGLSGDPIPNDNPAPQGGDVITFTPSFTNQGPGQATGVVVTVSYDASKFACPSGDCMPTINGSSAGTDDSTPGTITFTIGSLASGATVNLSYKLEVDSDAQGSGNVAVFVSAANENDVDSSPSVIFTPPPEDDTCVQIFDALPVELTVFEARLDGAAVRLLWETASETNNAGFEVQHRHASASKIEFEALGYVEGHGTTIEAQRYSFGVADLAPGRHVFRLKQLDYDGTFEYSPEVEVSVEIPDAYVVSRAYPNPFNPEARLSLGVKRAQTVEVALYDVLGRQVRLVYAGTLEAGVTRSLVIDGSGLQSGTYLLRVQGETFVDTQTLTLIK